MADAIWRLILDGPVEGAMNMALDRAVLDAHEAGAAAATLRLYWWEVPTVTLGRFQEIDQVDLDACAGRGFDVVRRPTGGRGVLHDRELTYSVVAGVRDGVPRGVAASYRHLSAALAAAYHRLGVPAELTARPRGEAGAGACYLHSTQADLSMGAAKLSGSAQVWHGDSVLQHGSFVISRNAVAEAEVFRLDPERAAVLERDTMTLDRAVAPTPSREEVAAAVTEAFADVLEVRFEPGSFDEAEWRTAVSDAPSRRIRTAVRAE
ncbi:MAG: biotin/lipoate A/B protein ligase family protein [Coriobacteriia bacterium]|nr:biotin/lipoate A/B protein ligase family protein [Coriobacteriia bacterium]